tara:strand:+ start:76 stop:258 length:183 start_codon:yes stop_codon:yes gene_type:complete
MKLNQNQLNEIKKITLKTLKQKKTKRELENEIKILWTYILDEDINAVYNEIENKNNKLKN